MAFTYANSEQAAHQLADELSSKGQKVIPLKADSHSSEQVIHAIHKIIAEFGKIDILVNNVGIFMMNKIQDMTLEEIENIIAVKALLHKHFRNWFPPNLSNSRHNSGVRSA